MHIVYVKTSSLNFQFLAFTSHLLREIRIAKLNLIKCTCCPSVSWKKIIENHIMVLQFCDYSRNQHKLWSSHPPTPEQQLKLDLEFTTSRAPTFCFHYFWLRTRNGAMEWGKRLEMKTCGSQNANSQDKTHFSCRNTTVTWEEERHVTETHVQTLYKTVACLKNYWCQRLRSMM